MREAKISEPNWKATNCQDKEILSWWKLFPEVSVRVDVQRCPRCMCCGGSSFSEEKTSPTAYFSSCWKYRSLFLALLLARPHGAAVFPAGRLPSTGDADLSQESCACPYLYKQTPNQPRSLPVATATRCFSLVLFPCCAVVASPFLQNCSQGGTEELCSKSQLCPGWGRGFPQPCRSGSARFRLGSQLPWLLAGFNQARMKACSTEVSAMLNRPGSDKWTPLTCITGGKLVQGISYPSVLLRSAALQK